MDVTRGWHVAKTDDHPGAWLGATIRGFLNERYGGKVPGVRRISADIKAACDGETISHGHIHNILAGEADNLTDRTRTLLARFFGKPITAFLPEEESDDTVRALAARFATLDDKQVAAIKQAIEIVTRGQ
ncbi:hypothetical protein [Lentzea tibetensis]|uniref:hypothetical protein n=1 Tax=Lentzea tibetensis TaxID=2591470 RepID=UPI0016475941|nr:hypothetical protein [Lentzea tibetensis]